MSYFHSPCQHCIANDIDMIKCSNQECTFLSHWHLFVQSYLFLNIGSENCPHLPQVSLFYLPFYQRLKPQDSTLSFRICERQTFSLRQDREVLYSIRVQCRVKGQDYCYTTGMRNKKFGLGVKTSKSDVFTLSELCLPIHVTYQLLFPPSQKDMLQL